MKTSPATRSSGSRRNSSSTLKRILPGVLVLAAWLGTLSQSLAAPRQPLPPLPEAIPPIYRETFDWALKAGSSDAELVVPNYGRLHESFSGYALQRVGPVTPLVVPAIDGNGHTNVACDTAGALRFWTIPYWSCPPQGPGPGVYARLVELIVADNQGSAAAWSLQVTPDGTAVVLLGHTEAGPVELLKTPIHLLSGQAHCLVLNYGAKTELFVDGQLAGTGGGTLAVPPKIAALVWGSTMSGDLSAGADLDELCAFGRPLPESAVATYYNALRTQAALGPVSLQELAQRQAWFDAVRAAVGSSIANRMDEGEPPPEVCPQLKLTAFRTNCLDFQIHVCGMQTNQRYDLLMATNLGTRHDGADIAWVTVREIPPMTTNYAFPPTNIQTFYRVARLLDPDALPAPSLYVKADAPPGGDGSKDLPFQDIKSALTAATNYSLIQVLPGVYAGSNNCNLSVGTKKLILLSERGWEQTIIDCTNVSGGRAFVFTSTNASPQDVVIIGFTVTDATNSAVYCSGGSRPTFINCNFTRNRSSDGGGAVYCTNARPVFVNCRFLTNSAATQGGAVYAVGWNATPWLSHCTLNDNLRATGGGQIYGKSNAFVSLDNCIVWGVRTDLGAELVRPMILRTNLQGALFTNYDAGWRANFCDIRNWTDISEGTISVDPALETNATGRLTIDSPSIDQGTTNSVPGFRLFARSDMDGEARLDHSRFTNALTMTDIGADEFVYRVQFPLVQEAVWVKSPSGAYVQTNMQLSQVDEASGVAYLWTNATGPLISVVDDESRTNFYIYQLDSTATRVLTNFSIWVTNATYTNMQQAEVHDLEGLSFDRTNGRLFLITSQSKRNRYRDEDSSPPIREPVVDPPSNDYDRRRTVLLRMRLDSTLTTVTNWTFFESESNTVPGSVTYDATNGLAAFIRQSLTNKNALGATNRDAGVLIAWNTLNKFGTPQNGRLYASGDQLPYTTGGFSTNAGTVLGLSGTELQTGNATRTNWGADTRYYFKIWAMDSQNNYYEGPTASDVTDDIPPLVVNEFSTFDSPNTVEIFNPGLHDLSMWRWYLSDDPSDLSKYMSPSNITIHARGVVTLSPSGFEWKTNGTENLYLTYDRDFSLSVVEQWNMRAGIGNTTEGRVWDGGPRGFISTLQDFDACRFTNSTPVSPYPPTLGALNHPQRRKTFDVAARSDQGTIDLIWTNIGLLPATWRYSPKQHDFHSINVEDIAYRSPSEVIIGLRAPLSNRTSGNAYYFQVTNLSVFLTSPWPAADNVHGIVGPYQMALDGLGIRSIKWCPTGLTNAQGQAVARYLVLAGMANGGPLQREQFRQKFSLYAWDGTATNSLATPRKVIDDLWAYTIRPEGVDLIQVDGEWRVLFVEDRFQATGYATRNAIHWPLSILGSVE